MAGFFPGICQALTRGPRGCTSRRTSSASSGCGAAASAVTHLTRHVLSTPTCLKLTYDGLLSNVVALGFQLQAVPLHLCLKLKHEKLLSNFGFNCKLCPYIWAYKLLFLDVLFPLSLNKVWAVHVQLEPGFAAQLSPCLVSAFESKV